MKVKRFYDDYGTEGVEEVDVAIDIKSRDVTSLDYIFFHTDIKSVLVYPFLLAPDWVRNLSMNGGDEDWVVIYFEGSEGFWVAERLTICDYERFEIPYEEDVINVVITNHA